MGWVLLDMPEISSFAVGQFMLLAICALRIVTWLLQSLHSLDYW